MGDYFSVPPDQLMFHPVSVIFVPTGVEDPVGKMYGQATMHSPPIPGSIVVLNDTHTNEFTRFRVIGLEYHVKMVGGDQVATWSERFEAGAAERALLPYSNRLMVFVEPL